jgi:hypothetical protein
MTAAEECVEPTKEQVALLERLAHRYFRAALEAALEATWQELAKEWARPYVCRHAGANSRSSRKAGVEAHCVPVRTAGSMPGAAPAAALLTPPPGDSEGSRFFLGGSG